MRYGVARYNRTLSKFHNIFCILIWFILTKLSSLQNSLSFIYDILLFCVKSHSSTNTDITESPRLSLDPVPCLLKMLSPSYHLLITDNAGYPEPWGRMPHYWHHSSPYLIFSPVRCKNSKKTQNPHELGRHTDFPAGVGRFIYRPSSRIPPDTTRALKTGQCHFSVL